MNRVRNVWRAPLVGVALVVLNATVGDGMSEAVAQTVAQTGDPKVETIRPEIGEPVKAAQEFIGARKFAEALTALREADGIADHTPYENYVIDRLRAAAAAGAGDSATVAKSLEAIIASGRMAPAEQMKAMEALAATYFKAGNFPKAVAWTTRYFKDGGADPQIRMLQVQSLYRVNDYANAAIEMRAIVDATEKSGAVPRQDDLRLLASCYAKQDDSAGYTFALEKLLVYYPRKEYWVDAIRLVEARPGFADALGLDVLRLLQVTGNLDNAAQYTVMAQLALKVGFPAEAKRVIDEGFAAGVLGTGADGDVQRRLRDAATKQAGDDAKMLVQNARDAATAKDGTALVNTGFALVTAGQFDNGLALMEQGMQKGDLKRPEDDRLHLAVAYFNAGQKAKAIQTFKAVRGSDGTADLARLWLIHAQRSSI